MPVFFKCKNCGQEHQSPLFFPDEKSFTGDRLGVVSIPCPVTAKTAAYEKKNMFWIRGENKVIRHFR